MNSIECGLLGALLAHWIAKFRTLEQRSHAVAHLWKMLNELPVQKAKALEERLYRQWRFGLLMSIAPHSPVPQATEVLLSPAFAIYRFAGNPAKLTLPNALSSLPSKQFAEPN